MESIENYMGGGDLIVSTVTDFSPWELRVKFIVDATEKYVHLYWFNRDTKDKKSLVSMSALAGRKL